jgi:hypothetical protein
MTDESYAPRKVDEVTGVASHDELKCRAYELYAQRDTAGADLKDRLQAEMPRVLYAAEELAKYAKGEVGDIRSVRAARVYLRALSSVIGERDGH